MNKESTILSRHVNTWFPVHLLGNYSLINCEDAVKYKRERALIKLMH